MGTVIITVEHPEKSSVELEGLIHKHLNYMDLLPDDPLVRVFVQKGEN